MTEPGRLPAGGVVLGLDLGGTQIRAAAILPAGERLGRRSVATPLTDGEEASFAAGAGVLGGVLADLPADLRAPIESEPVPADVAVRFLQELPRPGRGPRVATVASCSRPRCSTGSTSWGCARLLSLSARTPSVMAWRRCCRLSSIHP